MKQPLWLLNSSVLLMFICAWIIAYALEEKPVKPTPITPKEDVQLEEQDAHKVSIARIYENDLFGTYVPQPEPKPQKPQIQADPPQPPQPKKVEQPAQSEPSFLAPLEVTLKGVIFANDESQTRAIIADTQSQEEQLYQVGDSIKDADVVYIGKEKVILMRSNGQQETLFTSQAEAEADPGHPKHTSEWGTIIEKTDTTTYQVDPEAFTQAIPHLAYMLDELDMTTAFKNGQAVGARIGNIENSSLGQALGLQSGDIITQIDDTSTDTTQKRVEIYHSILQKSHGDTIRVTLQRDGSMRTLTYVLQKSKEEIEAEEEETQEASPATLPANPIRENYQYNKTIMANGSKQKSTMDALQEAPTEAMWQRGGQERAIQRTS